MNLRIPGPTPCPEDILSEVARPMINHRGPEFREILLRVTQGLKQVFQTQADLFILTSSGTGAMEAAIVNTLSPNDKVLAVSIGVFGDRFARIAETYGARVRTLSAPWGSAVDSEQVREVLINDPEIKAVLIAHNETSTGVTNDLQAIAHIVKTEGDRLLLVDAVSSMGSLPLPTDDWECDVVVTGSQKGWMVPPGLAMASFSSRAWEAYAEATMARFYFDFGSAKRYLERGETPWTPAISFFYGLDLALDKLFQEGMQQVYERHLNTARRTRDGIKALGLTLFADERTASNTVTAVCVPDGMDGRQLTSLLREEYGVVVAGGQQSLEGKIFRIGHLGYVTDEDIDGVLEALSLALPRLGFNIS